MQTAVHRVLPQDNEPTSNAHPEPMNDLDFVGSHNAGDAFAAPSLSPERALHRNIFGAGMPKVIFRFHEQICLCLLSSI